MDFADLLATDCVSMDIGLQNLRCAHGLPGTEKVDLSQCLRLLDRWAECVEGFTRRTWPRFERNPAEGWGSAAKFRILAMVTALQRDLGVTYDTSCLSDPIDLADALPWFICGPITGRGGTCVSLPVLYAAVGRRLGYPLRLVRAKEHFFLRWDKPDERFNLECTSRGFTPYGDDRYRSWPNPLTEKDYATGRYLRASTGREELALCFSQRAHCLLDNLRPDDALEAFGRAKALCPDDRFCRASIAVATAVATYLDYESAGADFDRLVPEVAGTPPFVVARRELARIRGLRARRQDQIVGFSSTACFFASAH